MGLLDGLSSLVSDAKDAGQRFVNDKLGEYTSGINGLGSTFNVNSSGIAGKYDVSQYTYPRDLFSSDHQYGGNYVVFYINVAEDSKLFKESNIGGALTGFTVGLDERLRSTISEAGLTSKIIAGANAVLSGTAGTAIGSAFGASGLGGLLGAATGGTAGGIVSAIAGGKMSRQQKRLQTAIALNVPNSLNIRYSANWDPIETAGFQAVAGAISAGGEKATEEAQKGNFGSIQKAIKSAVSSGKAGAETLTPYAAGLATSGNVLSAASGLAPNPKKEQVFGGVDFRTFTFDYQFSPRTKEESRNVLNIINTFKLHMHPEFKDQSSFLFVYPSEFDITYYHYTEENKSLHKHTSCVLSDMSVNYTPNGNFNTFEDGTPTQIDVQLTFKELAILTKTEIQQGF